MKPSFLLDSSVCISVLRKREGLDKLPSPSKSAIPVIVAAELWTGVKKNLKTHPHQAARLQAFLDLFQVMDFDSDAALHYAEIRSVLEKGGNSMGPLDLLIAAQARSLGSTLVTANGSEFKRVPGLKVLEWN